MPTSKKKFRVTGSLVETINEDTIILADSYNEAMERVLELHGIEVEADDK